MNELEHRYGAIAKCTRIDDAKTVTMMLSIAAWNGVKSSRWTH